MKIHLVLATAFLALPAFAADTDSKDSAMTRALEAEVAALRAQLRAQSNIQSQDRSRESNSAARGEHHENAAHSSRVEYVIEIDGDLNEAPMGMIRSQLGDLPSLGASFRSQYGDMPADSNSMVIVNGKRISMGRFMEMTGQAGGGNMRSMPGFLPSLVMDQMDGHMMSDEELEAIHNRVHEVVLRNYPEVGQRMFDEVHEEMARHGGMNPFEAMEMLIQRLEARGMDPRPIIRLQNEIMGFGQAQGDHLMGHQMMDDEHLEAIHHEVHKVMTRNYPEVGQRMFDEVHEEMARHGGMDPFEAMEMLIHRLEERGMDPHPIIRLRDEVMGRGDHEGGHHEDPFFREGHEFVEKLHLSNDIADGLSDGHAVAILCIWEARQHLQPEERIEVLFPIMIADEMSMSVRNAAAMVVRESYVQLGDREKALETLQMQIRLNGRD